MNNYSIPSLDDCGSACFLVLLFSFCSRLIDRVTRNPSGETLPAAPPPVRLRLALEEEEEAVLLILEDLG